MKRKGKLYVVALTERYETQVWATSRQEAIDAVEAHGGSGPVWTKVTAQPIKGGRAIKLRSVRAVADYLIDALSQDEKESTNERRFIKTK